MAAVRWATTTKLNISMSCLGLERNTMVSPALAGDPCGCFLQVHKGMGLAGVLDVVGWAHVLLSGHMRKEVDRIREASMGAETRSGDPSASPPLRVGISHLPWQTKPEQQQEVTACRAVHCQTPCQALCSTLPSAKFSHFPCSRQSLRPSHSMIPF